MHRLSEARISTERWQVALEVAIDICEGVADDVDGKVHGLRGAECEEKEWVCWGAGGRGDITRRGELQAVTPTREEMIMFARKSTDFYREKARRHPNVSCRSERKDYKWGKYCVFSLWNTLALLLTSKKNSLRVRKYVVSYFLFPRNITFWRT